jgi:LCP family protein required for cell wall assembly
MTAAPSGRARRGAKQRSRSSTTRKRRKDPLWAKTLVLIGALLMMASGGALVGGRVLISAATGDIDQADMLGNAAADSGGNQIEGALNILLVGIDERTDQSEPTRSDSIIIMHVPASHDQAFMISLPRDLYVRIPANKKLHPNQESAKINAAFSYGNDKAGREGGFELLAETIKGFSGLSFNAGAIVNFGGFQKVVDALDGVDMCLDLPTHSQHIGTLKNGQNVPLYKYPNAKPVYYTAGCQHLLGWQALDYVRQRYEFPNGDYDRARHQQQFIKAVIKRAKTQGLTTNPTKALQVMKSAGSALTLATNGVEIADWAFTLRGVADNGIVMLKTNAGVYNPTTLPDGSEAEKLTQESIDMLAALREDRLAEFILAHPNFVANDTAG